MHIVPWSNISPICLPWQTSRSFSSVSGEAPPILLELQDWEREKKKKKDVMKAGANKASMLKNIELEEAHLDDKYLKTQQH